MVDYASLVLEIDSGPARTAATDLAKFNQAAVKASAGADKLSKTTRDARGRFISVSASVEKYGGEVERLAQKYNPALAAVYKFQQEQVSLNRAVALGVISQQQADAALERYTSSVNAAASASTRLGAAQKNTGAYTANVFAQLNDIGVMLAAGQNPIQLALQQGTQLNQVWAGMGEQGKSLAGVAGVLKGAIFSMVSPMSLLTLGTIAGAAALTQWAFSSDEADKASKNLNEKTDSLADSINNYARAAKLARQSAAGLTDEYGAQFAAAASVLGINAELAKNQIFRDLAVSAENINNQFQNLVGYVTQYDYMIRRGVDGADVAARQARLLKEEFGLTVDEARGLSNILSDILAASTPEKMAEAMSRFAAEVAKASQGNVEVSQTLRDAAVSANSVAEAVLKATGATGQAIGATNQWANAMMGVRSAVAGVLSALNAISGQAIGFAAAEAEINALKAGKKVAEARHDGEIKRIELEGVVRGRQLTRELGLRGKIQATIETAANLAEVNIQRELALERAAAEERERLANKKGGGGAALKQAEKQFQSLRELLEQDSMFQVAEYEKRQAQLDNALAKQLMSIQQYELMKSQLQTYYFGTEFQKAQLNYQMSLDQLDVFHQQGLIKEEAYQIQLAQLRGDYLKQLQDTNNNVWSVQLNQMAGYFGEMNNLAGGGYDALLKAQRVFGAASALISTYTGAAEALKLPFPYNMAAMGKVLAAGMGLVSAIKSGGSSAKASASSSSQTAVKQEPTKYMYVKLEGEDWAVSMAESIIEQIYDQSKDGRVIVSRY